jgi:predicted nucleic acid-binding Zn ribbon protein
MSFPRSLPGLLQESLQGLGLAERLRAAEIWRVWADVVGVPIATRAQPLRIINGTLTVAVSSAPWMQELRFMTGMMKDKLNSRLGTEVVREITLKAGKVEIPAVEAPEENLPKKRLTLRQKALIEEHSSPISDPEIRQAFAELMKASMESPG